MKRKATEELLAERPLPPFVEASQSKAPDPKPDEPDTSTGDDFESQDGHTAPSEAHSTPLTTAHSATTASRRFPSDLKTIPCTWPSCGKTFNRPARLTAHLRSHTNDRPFKCPDCAKTYLEEKHLRQHVKGSHTQERRYVCAECDKAFLTATRLRRHAAVHEGQDRFRCRGYDDACTRTFRKHQTLQRHIRVDHLHQPAFACHEVSSNNNNSGGTAAAAASSSSTAPCGAVFDSAGALRRHVEREHSAPKFWCEECSGAAGSTGASAGGTGFATRALLEAHMRHEHVTCPFCDARCGGPAELHKHIDMRHSGKTVADRKTIACPYEGCRKTFTRRANRNVHIRAAHEGLRFVCGAAADADADADVGSSAGDSDAAEADRAVEEDEKKPRDGGTADPELAAWDARAEGCGRGFVSKMKLEEHILYVHLRRERPAPAVWIMNTGAAELLGEDASVSAAPAAGVAPSADMVIDTLLGTNRTLACTRAGCAARFVRNHDLNVHLQRDHVTAAAAAEGEAEDGDLFRGDEFWVGAGDSMDRGFHDFDGNGTAAATAADVDDYMFGTFIDMNADLEGGLPPPPLASTGDDAQWQMDEAEMRRLIGSDDNDGGSTALLDPNLFV